MIHGNGDIASVLTDRDDLLFFAAGVSNSGDVDPYEYLREQSTLGEYGPVRHMVYFSSLSVFYADTPYTRHKLAMEKMVREWYPKHTIIRLGNISWGVNPTTLINHLRARHNAGLPVDIQDVYRYVVDLPEFLHWINLIPAFPCEMNIPGRRMKVEEIWREYVLMREYA